MRQFFSNLWRGEPAFFVGVVEILVQLGVLFVPGLSEMERAAFVVAVRAVGALVTRQGVYSPKSIEDTLPRSVHAAFKDSMAAANKKL